MWLIVLTMASYSAFTIAYGSGLLSALNEDNCDGLVGCVKVLIDVVGFMLNVMTLGGLASQLPILFRGVLLMAMALGWGTYIASMVADAV